VAELLLQRVEKTYPNGFKAVHGVDLQVRDGEFMVLVGPSGCAKSTLLRMIAGLEGITGGELHIGGRVVNALPPKQRGIAMVFQNYALYPHMTVFQNLAFGLELARTPKAEIQQRVHEAAELLEMTPLLQRYPRQLSGGQAQRVAVGRAIVKKPEVFLFDEPLSNLDAKLRASMRVRLTELHRTLRDAGRPATVVYVTHDQVEAMTMGERICVLKDGRIQQVDAPTTLYARPANAFVAGFIGSPEMNLLPVTALDAQHVQLGDVQLPLAPGRAPAGLAAGQPLQLGLRPEHLGLLPRDQGDSLAVTAQLRFLEHMGNEVFVHLTLGGAPLTARVAADQLGALDGAARDTAFRLHLQMAQAHFFRTDDGRTLLA
jgi:oligogalacturonide transport system ATP-binding protein